MKKKQKVDIDIYTQFRQDHKTGKMVSGKFVWVPDKKTDVKFENLYCNPEPTEMILPAQLSVNSIKRTRQFIGSIAEPTNAEAQKITKDRKSIKALDEVCRRYYYGCTCGQSYDNNCAHFLSNAFILSGYTDLLTSALITHRCTHGRPTRAKDMLRWFQAKQTGFYGLRVQRNTGIWATYQEKPGWAHVVVIDSNAWHHYGTGDYWEWNVQWNYRIQ